ncbi:Band 4.1-like protein 3 [Schistosoma japonicum]|nr:Band 4.1-like protein 3 [Schistosoma japonicum]
MSDKGSLLHKPQHFNHLPNDYHNVQYLEDGTIEVTDTLSKEEYYKSLRRRCTEVNSQNARPYGLSSQLSLETSQCGTLRSGFGKRKSPLHDYKPSGTEEMCYVLMLEGVEKTYTVDKNALGIHLFEKVCKQLDLQETEYFGLTYRTSLRVDNWLKLDKRIIKQVEKVPWKLEFRVRFYPPNVDIFKDDLTRYFLCLQLRQDIISGQLPCSHHTYVVLGAYVVQSDAGDYDPATHIGTDYIANIPFAPQHLQTTKMLQQIVELHKLHKGQSLVQADRGFLENARRLALYGVEFHRAKTSAGESICLGIYHDGILLYHGMLRVNRFSWPQIVKILHKSKNFVIVVRSMSRETLSKRGTLRRTLSPGGFKGADRKSNNSESIHDVTLTFHCTDSRLAKRLWDSCTTQHAFFRLRDTPGPQRTNLTTSFSTRKYHFTNKSYDAHSRQPSSEWIPRQQPPIKRVQTQRKPVQYISGSVAPVAYGEEPDQYYLMPGSPSPLLANAVNVDVLQNLPPAYRKPGPIRVPLPEDHWQMSAADCTQGLGRNIDGTDIAAMPETEWQGCRTNWGLKWPGAYYYEACMLEEGQVRLGWSTNDASLILGTDSKGFGYGADNTGIGSADNSHPAGQFMYANKSIDYGMPIVPGDIIGCYLELNLSPDKNHRQIDVHYSYNGQLLETPDYKLDETLTPDIAFFPAVSLKNARVELNFGDKPFNFPPKTTPSTNKHWLAVSHVPSSSVICNQNVGWRVNPNDVTSSTNLLVSPNGRFVQAVENTGWQGFRVNKGIFGDRAYYYEVRIVEDSGLARIGWSFENGSLDLGFDCYGFGYGADRDGFGINGSQGKKLHGDIIENYGEAFRKDDVIGCFLDLSNGIIQWSKNNRLFGPAYEIDKQLLKSNEPIYPAASLVDTTLELNYGDLPFKYPPEDDWTPLFAASDEYVYESAKWPGSNTIKLSSHPKKSPTTPNSKAEVDIEQKMTLNSLSDTYRRTTTINSTYGNHNINARSNNSSKLEDIPVESIRVESPSSSEQQEDEVRMFLDTCEPINESHFEPLYYENIKHPATERSESQMKLKPNGTYNQNSISSFHADIITPICVNPELRQNTTAVVDCDLALEQAILQTTHFNPHTSVLTNTLDVYTNNNNNNSNNNINHSIK